MSAIKLTDETLLRGSQKGWRLFRQNTGVGWVGKVRSQTNKMIVLENPRPLRAGLCVGSSDVIGIAPVVVTPEMVGKTIGVFVAQEIKFGNDRLSAEQSKFLAMVEKLGGIARVVRSVSDLE